jgi:hypothetical protein
MLSSITELQPLDWKLNLWNGLPLLLAGWPALALWRSRRRARRALMRAVRHGHECSLSGNRFVATYALLAAPWCARDLDEWWRTRRFVWRGAPVAGGAGQQALCVALPLYE